MKACIADWLRTQMGVDDADLLASLYDEYRATATRDAAQARADLAAASFAALDATAHKLKGAALTTGDEEMLAAALALRDAAKACDAAAAETAAARVDAAVAAL